MVSARSRPVLLVASMLGTLGALGRIVFRCRHPLLLGSFKAERRVQDRFWCYVG